ncbi:DUF2066 domain-containing protein [Candidatus Magnetaquicoccus inordinatus]|uniref:DUF2066 domain-containing protein n=1 Tax=Candidatus Magnetaquicoccus inordinatus TaxID=2496818 RepID=UPI00187D4722|nr:DUF2066 domain-containing protein [Candidatus Magnetaquicoccus inordinatus]
MTLPLPGKQEPRTVGVEKAKKLALERLLGRMFTRADLEREKQFFDSLLQGGKRLTERVQIVGETQRGNSLSVAVEVTFSAKGVAAAMAEKGLAYNESRHPPVLMLLRSQGGADGETATLDALLLKSMQEEAKAFGIAVVTPLGDVDDIGQLQWERVVAADPGLKQWVNGRYGTEQVWAIAVQLPTAAGKGKGGKAPTATLQAQLFGSGGAQGQSAPSEALQASVNSPDLLSRCSESTELSKCPATQLARALLQQVMDRWIQSHTVSPALQHTVQLRVIHGPKLAQFSQFTSRLRNSPGVVAMKFIEERATEATLQIEYQGQDAQLQELLSQWGGKVEQLPQAAAAPANRVDLVLQLP